MDERELLRKLLEQGAFMNPLDRMAIESYLAGGLTISRRDSPDEWAAIPFIQIPPTRGLMPPPKAKPEPEEPPPAKFTRQDKTMAKGWGIKL